MPREIPIMCIHDDKNWSDAEERAMIPKHISKIAPVMAKHIELHDKDLVCIAQHLQEYQRSIMCQESNVPDACVTCQYEPQCYKTGVSGDWIDAFVKISDIISLYIVIHLFVY